MTGGEQVTPPAPIGQPPESVKTDEIMAAEITDTVAGTHLDGKPTELGDSVYTAVLSAIKMERDRGVHILRNLARLGTGQAEKLATLARMDPNQQRAKTMGGTAMAVNLAVKTLNRAAELLDQPPGACPRCKGEREVESQLMAGEKVPCPSCANAFGAQA